MTKDWDHPRGILPKSDFVAPMPPVQPPRREPRNTHHLLAGLVLRASCKPGWKFSLETDRETGGLVLVITDSLCKDAYSPDEDFPLRHSHPVPMATYNERSWARWLFQQCRRTENHELGEWFKISGHRPFAPLHGPGEDPYTVVEYRDEVDSRTTQGGSIRPNEEE
jgi:hypothetical protein